MNKIRSIAPTFLAVALASALWFGITPIDVSARVTSLTTPAPPTVKPSCQCILGNASGGDQGQAEYQDCTNCCNVPPMLVIGCSGWFGGCRTVGFYNC